MNDMKEVSNCLEEIKGIIYRLCEKNIPQKVKYNSFGVMCPHCGGYVILPTTYTSNGEKIGIRCDYCYSCGQALDWSSE